MHKKPKQMEKHCICSRNNLKTPSMFPCAARVTMPQIGSENVSLRKKLNKPSLIDLAMKPQLGIDKPLDRKHIQKISGVLTFDEDVVRDRCFHMLPYDSRYLLDCFDVSDIITPYKTTNQYTKPKVFNKHTSCDPRLAKPPRLKPLKKKTDQKINAQIFSKQMETVESKMSLESSTQIDSSKTFLTEVNEKLEDKKKPVGTLEALQKNLDQLRTAANDLDEPTKKRPKSAEGVSQKEKQEWDAYLISQLSKLTAQWLVHNRIPPSKDKEELTKMLEKWYGIPNSTDLIEEDMSDAEIDALTVKTKQSKPKAKWKKAEYSLLEQVYKIPAPRHQSLDPYSDDNKAPFYRQPAGIRKQAKDSEKEQAGAINSTARKIKIQRMQPPKPPTLRDLLPSGIRNTLYDTENQFEVDLLTGVQQIYNRHEDGLTITMANGKKYRKLLKKNYPESVEQWCPLPETMVNRDKEKTTKCEHGHRRWKSLPDLFEDSGKYLKMVPAGFDPAMTQLVDPVSAHRIKQNSTLMQILNEWRSKWNMTSQFADSTYDDIIHDMADIQPYVRLKAICIVGKAAEFYSNESLDRKGQKFKLHERILVALDCLLSDPNRYVQTAAAITLFALECPKPKAQKILRNNMLSDSSAERWSAVQCLAHFGMHDSDIISEIIKQILDSEDPIKHERGITLLSKLSQHTTLVHGMVAEQLNNSSWRHRVIACKILPSLYGTINKDVTQKVTHLMWHDWHTEVRQAAAQCLGKTSHGRDVHDDIKYCLTYGNERIRLEAISRIGQLGIMTAKLLPEFLKCFNDQYMSIRCECCITSGNIKIQEAQVVDMLVSLAKYDPIWKVKALAIQALGKIGVLNEAVKETLLWAVRYEEKAAVRAEACHSIILLNITDIDVLDVLQDRLLVETSELVRNEIQDSLRQMGVSNSEDVDMVTQIKKEVRKLCTRPSIASRIIYNETDELRQQNLANMIYLSTQELERAYPKRNFFLNMLSMDKYNECLQMERRESISCLKEIETKRKKSKLKMHSLTLSAASKISRDHLKKIHSASHHSECVSPSVSREGSFLTISIDKELEDIFSREDSFSQHSMESSVAKSSRPITGESRLTVPQAVETTSRASKHAASLPSESHVEGKTTVSTVIEPAQSDCFALTPGTKSRLGLIPSSSLLEIKEPVTTPILHSDHKIPISRGTILEREKWDEVARSVYADLHERYANMINELVTIDSGIFSDFPETSSNFNNSAFSQELLSSCLPLSSVSDFESDENIRTLLGTSYSEDFLDKDLEINKTPGQLGTYVNKTAEQEQGASQDEDQEETANSFKQDKVTPSNVEGNELTPSSIEGNELTTNSVEGNELTAHRVERDEVTPNSVKRGEVTPCSTERGEVTPSSVERGEVTPYSTERGEVTPSSVERGEVTPYSTERGEVTPSSVERGEVTPSSVERGEVTPYSTERGEVTPSSVERGEVTPYSTERGDLTYSIIATAS